MIGAVIIKHKLSIPDEETVEPGRTKKSVKAIDHDNDDNNVSNSGDVGSSDAATALVTDQSLADELPRNHGKLILDATIAEQAIRYPTDLGLLNEARELSERIIDELHTKSNRPQKKKPRTYREVARKAYLSLVKLRRACNKKRRAGIRQQLQFLQRNLKHIEEMLTEYLLGTTMPLPNGLLRRYWVLPPLYRQQHAMYKTKTPDAAMVALSVSVSRIFGPLSGESKARQLNLAPK